MFAVWLPSIDLNFFSFVASALAVWLAWLAYRVTATVWIDVRAFKGGGKQSVYENNLKIYSQITVTLRNRGLTLHRPKLRLSFINKDGSSRSFDFEQVMIDDHHIPANYGDQFQPGMIAVFALKSYRYGETMKNWFAGFEGPRTSKMKLELYSQDYLVWEYPLWSRYEWLERSWTCFASPVNRLVGHNLFSTFPDDRDFRSSEFVRFVLSDENVV